MTSPTRTNPDPGSAGLRNRHEPNGGAAGGIACDGMTVRYGNALAVDAVSLSVGRGEIFGLLGANGAGKTS